MIPINLCATDTGFAFSFCDFSMFSIYDTRIIQYMTWDVHCQFNQATPNYHNDSRSQTFLPVAASIP